MKKILSLLLVFMSILSVSCNDKIGNDTTASTTTAEQSVTDILTEITLPPLVTDTTSGLTSEITTAEQTTPPETQPPFEPVRISFLGMGDNLIHSPIYKQSLKSDGTYDFLPKYDGVSALIKSADISFINQETPMCGAEYGYSNYPQFNTPQEMGNNLVQLGFDVIGFANNHMADRRLDGLCDMMDFTDSLDALIIGLYRSEDDSDNIRIYEYNGVKIAFLAYTYGTNIYNTKNIPSSEYDVFIPVYTKELVTRQITSAKNKADCVIVSMHWGAENKYKVTDDEKEYAQLIADLGADVIIGTHPHVIQPIEELTGKNGNKTLCYYSLGNGINCQDYLKNMVGICASFDIVMYEDGVKIENAACVPVFNYQSYAYKNVKLLLLSDLTEDMCKTHHCNKTDDEVTLEKAYKIITDTVSKEYLPIYLQ